MTEYIPKFEDDLERAYDRETLNRISQEVGWLINGYVDIKYMQLSLSVYNKIQHLPLELVQNYLEKEIFKVNNLIEEEPQWTMSKRPLLFITKKKKQKFSDNKYTDLEHLINGFSEVEVYDYLNYPAVEQCIDSKDFSKYSAIGSRLPIDNLPKINELIDYLAYLKHYKWLVDTFRNKTVKMPTLTVALPLNIILSRKQLNKLFELLKKESYIEGDAHKESFLWAFSNREKPIKNWTPIAEAVQKVGQPLLFLYISLKCIILALQK